MDTLLVACFCLVIAVVDLKTYRIPDILLIAFVLAMVILEGSQPLAVVVTRLATALGVFLLFFAVWYFSGGMGLGDVKYAAVLGYLLGFDKIFQALVFTAFLSIAIYIVGILLFHWSKTTKIPFAPFLSAGAIVSVMGNIL